MKSSFTRFLLTLLILLGTTQIARADYFLWADDQTGLSASFPDSWKIVNNRQPDDILTVALPSGADGAMCFIRADVDKRFTIYPNKFRPDIQKVAFSKNFWNEYNANYNNVKIVDFRDSAGLGKGFASTELISYITPPDEPQENRVSLLFVTNYGDKTYLAECSSTQASYQNYAVPFQSFMKTIDFKKAYHELTIGDHPRNFLNEGTLEFPDPNAVSKSVF